MTQCSFAFRTRKDEWSRAQDGTIVRRLLDVDLDDGDVAAPTFPAYPDTAIDVRHLRRPKGLNIRHSEALAVAAARERELDLTALE